jgi:hypothetical protein
MTLTVRRRLRAFKRTNFVARVRKFITYQERDFREAMDASTRLTMPPFALRLSKGERNLFQQAARLPTSDLA